MLDITKFEEKNICENMKSLIKEKSMRSEPSNLFWK